MSYRWSEDRDEDSYLLSCPRCAKVVYFGDFYASKQLCVDCVDEERNPDRALLRLVEKTIRADQCGDA